MIIEHTVQPFQNHNAELCLVYMTQGLLWLVHIPAKKKIKKKKCSFSQSVRGQCHVNEN